MLHTTVKIRYGSLVQSLILCAFLAFIFSCSDGGGGSDGKSSPDSGSISFGLAVQEDSNAQVGSMALAQATSPVDCAYHNMQWVLAEVYDKNGILVAEVAEDEKWDCYSGTGTIKDVPAEEDLKVVVRTIGFLSDDYNYRGEIKGITVLPGEKENAGTVILWPLKPPPAVTALTASKGTEEDMIVLEWEDVRSQPGFCSEDGYYVYRQVGDGQFEFIGETAADNTEYQDDFPECTPLGQESPQEYCYKVVAWNKKNAEEIEESQDSNVACGYTADCPEYPPDAASDLSASDGELEESIKLSWQWQGDGTLGGFRIYRSQSESGTYIWIYTAVGASIREYFDSYPECGGTPVYWYIVRAYNGAGESGDSNVDSGYTDICPIEPPPPAKELEASDGEFGESIELTWEWSGPGPLIGFRIYRSENEIGGTLPPVLDRVAPSSRTYLDSNLPCTPRLKDSPKLYWYLVVPYNSEGPSTSSDGSDQDSGYMRVPDNVTLQATPVYPGNIKLEWDDVDNADGYDIFRTTNPDVSPDWPLIDYVPAGTTTWVDDDAQLGCDLWYYSVVPYSCAGYADYLNDSGHIDSTKAEGCYNPESCPDLVVVAIDKPIYDGYPENRSVIRATIKNIGNAMASQTIARVIDPSTLQPTGAPYNAIADTPALSPGEEATVTFYLPYWVYNPDAALEVTADYKGQLSECNEDNNTMEFSEEG